jgi:putative Holliday junction resolvase
MGRMLALDIGEKRIGVAVSDETETLARPLTTIMRASRREDAEHIARLVTEQSAVRLIAGYPRSLSGDEGPQAQRVRRYVQALAAALPVPVELWDERYTTVEASERLLEAKPGRRKTRRGQLDAAAAAIILQDYLDAHRSPWTDEGLAVTDETRHTDWK